MTSSLDLDLPTGPELPPPPRMEKEAFIEYWQRRMADFYASRHYSAWLERTSEEMRHAKPFVWVE